MIPHCRVITVFEYRERFRSYGRGPYSVGHVYNTKSLGSLFHEGNTKITETAHNNSLYFPTTSCNEVNLPDRHVDAYTLCVDVFFFFK